MVVESGVWGVEDLRVRHGCVVEVEGWCGWWSMVEMGYFRLGEGVRGDGLENRERRHGLHLIR